MSAINTIDEWLNTNSVGERDAAQKKDGRGAIDRWESAGETIKMGGQRPTDSTRSVAAANQRRFDVPESVPEISVSKVRVTEIAAQI